MIIAPRIINQPTLSIPKYAMKSPECNAGYRRVLEKCGFKVVGEDKYVNIGKEEVEEFVLRLD